MIHARINTINCDFWVPGYPTNSLLVPNPDPINLFAMVLTLKDGNSHIVYIPYPPEDGHTAIPLVVFNNGHFITWNDILHKGISRGSFTMVLDNMVGIGITHLKARNHYEIIKDIRMQMHIGPEVMGTHLPHSINFLSRKIVSDTWIQEALTLLKWAGEIPILNRRQLLKVLKWVAIGIPGIPGGDQGARYLGAGFASFDDLRGDEERAIVCFHIAHALYPQLPIKELLGDIEGGGTGVQFVGGGDILLEGYIPNTIEPSADHIWLASFARPYHAISEWDGPENLHTYPPRGVWKVIEGCAPTTEEVRQFGLENNQRECIVETVCVGGLQLSRIEAKYSFI